MTHVLDSAIVAVYAVFADAGEAERIGRGMIERRLAACVNILGPCRSIYRWQGKVEEADEVAAIFKTALDRVGPLIAAIGELHSYEVPAIATLPIAGSYADYLGWVLAETRDEAAR